MIYEYHCCFYHGHEDALSKLKSKPTPEKWTKRQSDSRKRTSAHTDYLISQGYTVVEMWECTYTKTTLRLMDIMDEVDHKYLPHCSDMLNSGNMWIAPRRDYQRLRGDYIQTLERHIGGDLDIKVEHPYRGEIKWRLI